MYLQLLIFHFSYGKNGSVTPKHFHTAVVCRVRRSFRLEAKRCEKGSEKVFASKRNKGLVSLVSLRSETAIFACETKWTQSEK
jgi:hypothetical protein